MPTLSLGHGVSTIVDDADYAFLSQWKWRKHKSGYASRETKIGGKPKTIWLHRLIVTPADGMQVDHVNGDKLDNRRVNLRQATPAQNMQNRIGKPGALGVKGVRKDGSSFRATITNNGKRIHLGTFDTIEEASNAYVEASLRLHGEFSILKRSEYERAI